MATFHICTDEWGPEPAGPPSDITGCLYTAKISVKYKSKASQVLNLSSHSDSAAAACEHDRPKVSAAEMPFVHHARKHSIYSSCQTLSV